MLTYERVRKIPKAELHCHLDGSMSLQTLVKLAQLSHVKLPTDNTDELAMIFGKKWSSLEECLDVFKLTTSVMQTYRSLVVVAWELVRDVYAVGVRHLEIRFAPHLHTQKGMTNAEVLDAVLFGLRGASSTFGIKPNVIVCGIRNMLPDLSLEMARLAVANKPNGVVGFDLAGVEVGFPPSLHAEAIRLVKDGGLGLTIHAGEAGGPELIREALDFGADRIGHGYRIVEDTSLLATFVEKQVPIECCVSSNLQTGACVDVALHPIKELLRAGANVTINTDNTLVHNTNLSKELLICHEQIGLTEEEINKVIANGFGSVFKNYVIQPR